MTDEAQTEVHPVTQMGSTFAERKAAYAKAVSKVAPKQVDEDSADVEDKAVKPTKPTKRPTKKS